MRQLPRVWLIILCVMLLVACGRSTVVRREHPVRVSAAPVHTRTISSAGTIQVARGDTLYGIAFRADLDYRDLARWNGIRPPYTIYPGQRLSLRGPPSLAPSRKPPPPAVATRGPKPATTQDSPATSPKVPRPITPVPAPVPSAAPTRWRWPTAGTVITRFVAGDSTRQGIDITGQAGQPVVAVAAGTVVYSGSGLVGYGELVIVKHSDEWLSAYGHNRRRLVAEGSHVDAGQAIAEMGRTGASRDMLHFEIRRNGKPVDPLPLLPGR